MSRSLQCVFLSVALVTGCSVGEWDVDNFEGLESNIIGKQYETQSEMGVLGITLDQEKTIDYYEIVKNPGVAVSEVVTVAVIPSGTIIEVLRIEKCTNCWVFEFRRYVVSVVSDSSFDDKLVVINENLMDLSDELVWKMARD